MRILITVSAMALAGCSRTTPIEIERLEVAAESTIKGQRILDAEVIDIRRELVSLRERPQPGRYQPVLIGDWLLILDTQTGAVKHYLGNSTPFLPNYGLTFDDVRSVPMVMPSMKPGAALPPGIK